MPIYLPVTYYLFCFLPSASAVFDLRPVLPVSDFGEVKIGFRFWKSNLTFSISDAEIVGK